MEWAVHRTLPLPPGAAPAAGSAPWRVSAACVAAHALHPLLAVGTADALLVLDTVSGARLAHLRCAAPPVALAFAPPSFGGAGPLLLAALADGAVLLLDCASGRALRVATSRPPKPAACALPTLLLPLPGAPAARCVLASPGRSAVFSLDLSDAVSHLQPGATSPPHAGGDGHASSGPGGAALVLLKTEHKRPAVACAAHPGASVAYVGYADGAVRGYDACAGAGASAVRAATRVDKADASAPGRGGSASSCPAVVALCLLPHGAASGYAHLLVAADASGRLAAWEASPNSGALTPLCALSAAPPGAPAALAVRSLAALPGQHAVLARCDDGAGGAALHCFAAAPGGHGGRGTLERAPPAAPSLHALRPLIEAATRDATAPAAAASQRPAAAAALPACGSLALLLQRTDGATSEGCVLLLRTVPSAQGFSTTAANGNEGSAQPLAAAALHAPCLLAAPAHLPLRHFFAGVGVAGGAGDAAADAEEEAAGSAPGVRRAFDLPSPLFFATGEAVARCHVAPAPVAQRVEELQPALEAGWSLSHLVRSDAAAATLAFARPAPHALPAAMAMLSDGPPPRCTPMRACRDGAFFGPADSCVALLDSSGTALALFATPAAGGGPGAAATYVVDPY